MTRPDHCPYCQAPPSYRVEVHGHVQCQRCGVNIQPCCDGAQAGPDAEKVREWDADPEARGGPVFCDADRLVEYLRNGGNE